MHILRTPRPLFVLAIALVALVSCSSGAAPFEPPQEPTPTVTILAEPSPTPGLSGIPSPSPTLPPLPAGHPSPTATFTPAPPPQSGKALDVDRERLAVIDQHALAAPDAAEQSIKALATYLVTPAQSDVEKTRAIYRWITENIAYDFPAYLSGDYGDQRAEVVLKRRTAVCAGYAELFKALGAYVGLQVEIVEGWSKGYDYVNTRVDKEPNHAWNAVRLNGAWYLVEPTWGAGSITEKKQFEPKFEDYYFLTPPQQLIATHFPVDARWQLLSTPLTREEFLTAPRVWPRFFDSGLGLVSHKRAVIQANSEVAVTLSAPQDTLVLTSLHKGDTEVSDIMTFVQREGAGYGIKAAFPEAGQYRLTVYSKKAAEEGNYVSTLEYTVDVAEGDPNHPGFPQVWPTFFENRLGFRSHTGGIIKTAGDLEVILSAPADVLLLATLSLGDQELPDSHTFVQRVGADYSVRAVFPQAGDYTLTIFSKRAADEEMYHSTLAYSVQAGAGSPDRSFPEIYATFREAGAVLHGPFDGALKTGSTYSFKVAVPGAEKVAVIIDNDWRYLDGADGVFQGNVTINGR
ncbi:MAG: hypothetical protein HY681_09150, partial [Chloroflexi bacterium]|nr:hypothetical protein [Chloroflexota bacterium]